MGKSIRSALRFYWDPSEAEMGQDLGGWGCGRKG